MDVTADRDVLGGGTVAAGSAGLISAGAGVGGIVATGVGLDGGGADTEGDRWLHAQFSHAGGLPLIVL